MPRRLHRIVLLCTAFCVLMTGRVSESAETVAVPVTLNYPAVRLLLARQLYTEPGERALVLNQFSGCNTIELWEPEVDPEGSLLRVGSRIRVNAGMYLFGTCRGPKAWEGYIELLGELKFEPDTWNLRFDTLESRLYNPARERTEVASVLWDLIKTHVHAYLNRLSIDLAPPVGELKAFIPTMMGRASALQVKSWLDTLRPGPVSVDPEALRTTLLMEAPLPPPEDGKEEEAPLAGEELERFVRLWETWDAFLVYQIRTLGAYTLSDEERRTLLDTLLETRYRFVEELEGGHPGRDMVRRQFVEVWNVLAPMFQKHLEPGGTDNPLIYLAFFTASDALAALDRLGPTLNIEISRSGLRRLARMLNREGPTPSLGYRREVDPALLKSLGIPPLDDEPPPLFPEDTNDDAAGPSATLISLLRSLFPGSRAWASEPEGSMTVEDMRRWLVPSGGLDEYLKRVRALLNQAANAVLNSGDLNPELGSFFQRLVPATAWQESCFRQFTVRDGQIWYLRSYNNTSVGIMQINERVWRGVYDREKLRWNIWYNARAGCRILARYIHRYALKALPASQASDQDLLARVTYAVYNGGPSQSRKFLERHAAGSHYQSDRLFWEKYAWVKNSQWNRITACLR